MTSSPLCFLSISALMTQLIIMFSKMICFCLMFLLFSYITLTHLCRFILKKTNKGSVEERTCSVQSKELINIHHHKLKEKTVMVSFTAEWLNILLHVEPKRCILKFKYYLLTFTMWVWKPLTEPVLINTVNTLREHCKKQLIKYTGRTKDKSIQFHFKVKNRKENTQSSI